MLKMTHVAQILGAKQTGPLLYIRSLGDFELRCGDVIRIAGVNACDQTAKQASDIPMEFLVAQPLVMLEDGHYRLSIGNAIIDQGQYRNVVETAPDGALIMVYGTPAPSPTRPGLIQRAARLFRKRFVASC